MTNTSASKPLLYYLLESLHLKSQMKKGDKSSETLYYQYQNIINSVYESHRLIYSDEEFYRPSNKQLYYLYGIWKNHYNKSEAKIDEWWHDVLWYKSNDKAVSILDIAAILNMEESK